MDLNVDDLPKEIILSLLPMLSEYGYVTVHTGPIDGYAVLGNPVEVTFKLAKKEDISKQLVVTLRQKIQETRAKSEMECSQIEERIQSLLALPNKG